MLVQMGSKRTTIGREASMTRRHLSSRLILALIILLEASCSDNTPQKQKEAATAVDASQLERERRERIDNVKATKHLQNISSNQESKPQ